MSCKLLVEYPTTLTQNKCEVCKRVTSEVRIIFCVAAEPKQWFNVVHARCIPQASGVLGRLARDEVLAFAKAGSMDRKKIYDELQMLDKPLKSCRVFPFKPNKAFDVFDPTRPAPVHAVPTAAAKFAPPPWMRPGYQAPSKPPQAARPRQLWLPSAPSAPSVRSPRTLGAINEGGFMEKLARFEFECVEEKKSCSVCLEIFGQGEIVVALPCTCLFHWECARQCFCKSDECPNDRTNVRQALKHEYN